jgi:hypothetical protein
MVFGKRKKILKLSHFHLIHVKAKMPTMRKSLKVFSFVENSTCTCITNEHTKTTKLPLAQEVIYTGVTGKNLGGTKNWTCKHCNNSYKSGYTRAHHHFFGHPPGKEVACNDVQH